MAKEKDVLDMELQVLQEEILEYKIYIEVCAITLFFVMVVYLGSNLGLQQLQEKSFIAFTILSTAIILFLAIFFMLFRILYIVNSRIEEIKHKKKELLRDWIG